MNFDQARQEAQAEAESFLNQPGHWIVSAEYGGSEEDDVRWNYLKNAVDEFEAFRVYDATFEFQDEREGEGAFVLFFLDVMENGQMVKFVQLELDGGNPEYFIAD